MVIMCMGGQQDLYLGEPEPQRLDMLPDHRRRFRKSRIDQYMPLGGSDEIGRQVISSHIIQVARNAKRRIVPDPAFLDIGKLNEFLGARLREYKMCIGPLMPQAIQVSDLL